MRIAENLKELMSAQPGDGVLTDTIFAFLFNLATSHGWNFKEIENGTGKSANT